MANLTYKAYDVRKLSINEIEELCVILTNLSREIFGLEQLSEHGYEYYLKNLTDEKYFFNRIEIFKDEEKFVGYTYYYVREIRIDSGKEFSIVRGEVGILDDYRNNNISIASSVRQGMTYYTQYFWRDTYYFGQVLNPISYHILGKHTRYMYPRPDGTTSDEIKELYDTLLQVYDIKLVAPYTSALKVKVDELTDKHKKMIQNSDSPYVKFFLQNNPDYAKGFVMPIVIQMQLQDVMYAQIIYFKTRFVNTISSYFYRRPNNQQSKDIPQTLALKPKL